MNKKIFIPLAVLDFLLLIFVAWASWRINQLSTAKTQIPVKETILSSQTAEEKPKPAAISLESIFSAEKNDPAVSSETGLITLIATGDVMLGRSVNTQSVKLAYFDWPWEKAANVLNAAEISLINLESPLGFNCPVTNEGMKFCADSRQIGGLVSTGIDVINLANNHINDQGAKISQDTESLLETNNLLATGLSEPAFKNVRGALFAFLGYCDVCWGQSKAEWEKVSMEIGNAQQFADVVVVSFHWGEEYSATPSARQKELAHLAIDNGADLVIGHHPHWIQPVEVYKGKLIAYSLGNFIFDQNWSQKTKEGLALQCIFQGDKLIGVDLLPVLISNSGQPEFAVGEDKERILNELKEASLQLAKT